jgi:hypothetical protein
MPTCCPPGGYCRDCRAFAARAGLVLDVLDMPRPRETPAGEDMAEETLLNRTRRLALDHGFLFYHTYDARRSEKGFVDCVCAKPGHPLYLWELKSERGKLTADQLIWQEFLALTRGTQVAVYRPSQWALIEACLTRKDHV